jgi:hypothetical protein
MIKQIGLLKFKQGRVIIIKPFQDLGHDGFAHKLAFIPDLIFLAIQVDGFLFPAIEQYRGSVATSQLLIFGLILHLAMHLVCLKIRKAPLPPCAFMKDCINK